MAVSRLHVAVGSLVGLGVGLVGGYLLRAPPTPCPPLPEPPRPELPVGHYYVIGEDIYVDEGFVRWLLARVSLEREGTWLALQLATFKVYLADLRRVPWHFYFEGQIGRRFLVRTEDNDNDREAVRFLEALVTIGVLGEGGRWSSWDELFPGANAGAEKEKEDDGQDA